MVVEGRSVGELVFIDTSLIVAATVEVHPSHQHQTVLRECLELVRRFDVHGKQVHDCNIVATMRAHGVERLATRNSADIVAKPVAISSRIVGAT